MSMDMDLDERLREVLRATTPTTGGPSAEVAERDVHRRVGRRRTRRRALGALGCVGAIGVLAAGGSLLGTSPDNTVEIQPADEPPITAPESSELVVVHDAVGFHREAATRSLEDAGFVVVVVEEGTPNPDNVGKVLTQEPQPGQLLAVGSTVQITVGVFDNMVVMVPDVVGLPEVHAQQSLVDAGLVGSVVYNGPVSPDMVVMAQNPLAGDAELPRGSIVTLLLAVPEG